MAFLESGDKKMVEPSRQQDNTFAPTDPLNKVPPFFQALPPTSSKRTTSSPDTISRWCASSHAVISSFF